MIQSIIKELEIKSRNFKEAIETIYFGGGTPSIISDGEISKIIEKVFENYLVSSKVEITLEANPGDLDNDKLNEFIDCGINRISLGIQVR